MKPNWLWHTSSGQRHIVFQPMFLQGLQPPSHSSSLWSNQDTWTCPWPPLLSLLTPLPPQQTLPLWLSSSAMSSHWLSAQHVPLHVQEGGAPPSWTLPPYGLPPPWTPPSDPHHPHKPDDQGSCRPPSVLPLLSFPHRPLDSDVKKAGRYGTLLPQSSPDFKHLLMDCPQVCSADTIVCPFEILKRVPAIPLELPVFLQQMPDYMQLVHCRLSFLESRLVLTHTLPVMHIKMLFHHLCEYLIFHRQQTDAAIEDRK